jgi:hypothetical protein
MLKNRSLRFAALLAVSLGLVPSAFAAAERPQSDKPYVFETVDSYLIVDDNRVEVTGILQGESAPRTFAFRGTVSTAAGAQFSRCDRMALLSMSKPGLYLFTMVQAPENWMASTCQLTRR